MKSQNNRKLPVFSLLIFSLFLLTISIFAQQINGLDKVKTANVGNKNKSAITTVKILSINHLQDLENIAF